MSEERGSPSQIDLRTVLRPIASLTLEEHERDRESRIKVEERQIFIEDCKGVAVFSVIVLGIVAVATLCAYVAVFDSTAPVDTKKWAQTLLLALVTGSLSFVLGRKVGGSK